MSGFLLDTNVLSELIKPRPDPGLVAWVESANEDLLFLSVLTLGEIRKGITRLRTGAKRAALEAWLESDLRTRFAGRILEIDEAVADEWGTLAGRAVAAGRPLPVIDGLLAATAARNRLTLVTRDSSQVEATGVAFLNPWSD